MRCVAALPDGAHFVVGLAVPTEVGCTASTAHVHAFRGREVNAVAVTPDGQHIIGGSWQVVQGVERRKQEPMSTAPSTPQRFAVAAMPDSQRFLSGWDNKVRVWLLNGTPENNFELHTASVSALAALPDNQHALSASLDNDIKLFNFDDGTILRTFTHHSDKVRSLALLPDGFRFVSGSYDDTACIVEHGLAFMPTTDRSELKAMIEGAEAELRLSQEKVRQGQERLRVLKQRVAPAK